MSNTERITAAEFLARTTVTPAGKRMIAQAQQPVVQDNGNLFPGIKPTFYIGIDPGVNVGFALWQARQAATPGRFIEVNTLTFWTTIFRLNKLVAEFGATKLRVRIEDVRGNKPTFSEREGNSHVRERMSQNIGSNKRDCQLLIEYLDHKGIPNDAIVPKASRNGTAGKVGAELFNGVIGFPTRSSQHARDAAKLVLGL
jgi:hypothetical protein